MTTPSGGDLVADTLLAHGVRFLFTLCGGHISPILVSAKRRGIRVVDTRHEVTAVFAADAVARLTGVPGVAAVTAGPGLTNTITAVKNARLAQSPVVLLGGATATALKGRGALQDIDQEALLAPHVKELFLARRVRDLVPMLTEAFRVARDGVPGPVFVECPVDLLYQEETVRSWYGKATSGGGSVGARLVSWYLNRHLDRLFSGVDARVPPPGAPAPMAPAPADVADVARLLTGAERPVAVVGSGALLSPERAAPLAAALGALGLPVYLSGMARGLLGPAHPFQMRQKRKEALREADVVLLAGTPCDFRLDYGRQIGRAARLISVNRVAGDLTRNRRPHLGLHADPGLLLEAVAARGPLPARPAWLETLRARDAGREAEIAAAPPGEARAVDPVFLCREIEKAAGPGAAFVADGGDFVATASYVLRPRGPLAWLDPGVFGTLGVGAGFALGAALCRGGEVWALFGDGSVGYGLVEFDTFVRHGIPVIAVVGNDAGWTQIAREQVEVLGDDVGTVLAATDYHAVAAGFGAEGLLLDGPDRAAAVLARARELAQAGRPVLVNAILGKTAFRKGSISI